MAAIKPVIFKLSDMYFGVDINKVIAIEQSGNVVPVPNAVDYVEGLINIRGEVIPVYNLKSKNGIKASVDGANNEYILVWCKNEKLALSVDSVEDIKDLKDGNYQPLPIICRGEKNAYIAGIAQLGGKLSIIIDVDRLLTKEELEGLSMIKD